MPVTKPLVLVVDDNDELRDVLVELVDADGFQVAGAKDGADALRMLPVVRPGIVLLDMNMPTVDGLEFLARLREVPASPAPVVIAMSADPRFADVAKKMGALEFIEKPIDATVLTEALAEACAGRPLRPETHEHHLEEIRGKVIEDDARRDEVFRHSTIATPEFHREVIAILRWLSGYFDIPMALVNLLTQGRLQLFETYGTPPGYRAGAAMNAEDTYCAGLTRNTESLVLHDASLHPLYRDHPVTKLGVRFYVSMPIRTGAGLSLGTLCLESVEPVERTTFRTEDLILLRYFADLLGKHVYGSVTEPQALRLLFPDPSLLEPEAFRAVVASRIAPPSVDAFPVDVAKLEGSNTDFVLAAGRVFDSLPSRRRLAIARQSTPRTVACVGASERVLAFTAALASRALRFTSRNRSIVAPIASAALDELFAAPGSGRNGLPA